MYKAIRPIADARTGQPDAIAVALAINGKQLSTGCRKLDEQVGGILSVALKRNEVSLAKGAVTCLYPSQGVDRLFVVGLGNADKLDTEALRIGSAKLLAAASEARIKRLDIRVGVNLSGRISLDEAGRALGDGMALTLFQFDDFKGVATKSDGKSASARLAVHVERDMQSGFKRALTLGESVNFARQLAATPPNVANPAWLTSQCRQMARKVGLNCTVISAAQAKKLGMGGLVAVGSGGSTPPAMICLEYKTKDPAGKKQPPVMLVGKAVTFDTGGYSLKPSASMDGMKYDKCGGTAVIGAMRAVATLKPNVNVVGIVPTAENMVDTTAYRPGDIIKFYNGVTAEITNTDAEGRLILADALAYGTKKYQPQAVVDLATLTGGVVVALGSRCAGCFCGNGHLRGQLFDAADATGERLWHLPLWLEHRDLLKSVHADIVNSGGREAHAIQGAAFLSYFIHSDEPKELPKLPWAHLDIAGVSDCKNDTDLYGKGPTGYGVRLLSSMLENWRAG